MYSLEIRDKETQKGLLEAVLNIDRPRAIPSKMPIILAFRSLRQEDCEFKAILLHSKFQISLSYVAKPWF